MIVVGVIMTFFRKPGPTFTSIAHHFAAGVVFAAVGVGLLPNVLGVGLSFALTLGFLIGMGTMLLVQWGSKRLSQIGTGSQLPWGLLIALGIDVFIDGILLGVAFLATQTSGRIIAFAIAIEVLFLGLAAASNLQQTNVNRCRQLLILGGIGLLIPVGTFFSMTILSLLPPAWLEGILAFGIAALLYLAGEELLTEAHETKETPWITSTFFFGFLFVMLLEDSLS